MEQLAKRIDFSKDTDLQALFIKWWDGLADHKGDRAILRRASSPAEVVFVPYYHELVTSLQRAGYSGINREAVACVAGLASHVKIHTPGTSLASSMAASKNEKSALVSALRFRRLLAAGDRDELYPLMIRVMKILDGAVNLVSLSGSVYWWNDRVRKEWAYEYYQ